MRATAVLGVFLLMAPSGAFTDPQTTGAFRAALTIVFVPDLGPATAAFELSYPGNTVSEPGQLATWPLAVASPGTAATVSFIWADSFTGPTAGYHFVQLLLGDRVLWEHDVAGGDLQPHRVEVPLEQQHVPPAGDALLLAFRLFEKKQVTNFPVRVQIAEPTLHVGERAIPLMARRPLPAAEPWPDDLPLPSLPVIGGWTWQANIIQPWGRTQTTAIKQAEEWAPRFAREHGLNAMIVLPPAAHNAITGAHGKPDSPHHVSDAEFRQAVSLYRREGVKLILYSSIMHMGHDPQWQFGEIAKTHPEWAMRDAAGDTVNIYGNPWLCPSTGALQATIDYTAALVRAYDADAVMLDNNEFMQTQAGRWTCHCDSCRRKFGDYLLGRFGAAIPGVGPTAGRPIPTDETDPMWGLWLSWRNRVWAEACEEYRGQLRRVKPGLVLLANTQYQYSTGLLAVDGQYAHLDAVLSESRGMTGPQMAAKMLLGRALAEGRPLWNYIGTFEENDFTRLRPADEIAGICAASEAVGANPWIVFYGFTGEANQPSLEVIRRYTDFWRDNADLLGASRLGGDAGVLVSTESRDLAATALLPSWTAALLCEGCCLRPVRDAAGLTAARLAGLRVLTATANPCMRADTAQILAGWVRQGGTLITTAQTGWRDEYGRWRHESALSQALGTNTGKGRVLRLSGDQEVLAAVRELAPAPVPSAARVGACRLEAAGGRTVLSLVGFDGPPGEVTMTLPAGSRRAELRMPGHKPQALIVSMQEDRRSVTCRLPERLGLIVCSQ